MGKDSRHVVQRVSGCDARAASTEYSAVAERVELFRWSSIAVLGTAVTPVQSE